MDLNEQMKQDYNRNMFSPESKSSIYDKYMIPLKAKISEILLYDTETAIVFLKKYNEIAKKEDMTTIMEDTTELDFEINEYKKNKGKEKLFEGQSITIIQQLEKLLAECEELDIKDFENKFSDIKEMYSSNLVNYSYADREILEQKISSAQARLIMRKCRENILDLHSEIPEEDVARLTMAINNGIYTLMQSQNTNIQDIVNEIKYKMIDRKDAVYDVEIWRLLDSAQRSGERIEQKDNEPKIEQRKAEPQQLEESSTNTLLPAIPKQRRNFHFPSLGGLFQRRTLKIGKRRMTLADTVQIGDMTVKVQDLANIDMEWLEQRIPEEMLIAIENKRLEDEGKNNEKEKYIMDGRLLIYKVIQNLPTEKQYEFDFYDNDKYKMHLTKFVDPAIKIEGVAFWNTQQLSLETEKKLDTVYSYVEFIDDMVDSNLSQQFYNEMGSFFELIVINHHDDPTNRVHSYEIDRLIKKLPIFNNLYKSYKKLERYVDKTKDAFEQQEEVNRKKFYENNQFKNELKVDDNGTKEVSTCQEESEKVNEKDNNYETNGTSDRGGE